MQRPDGRVLVGGSRASGPGSEIGVYDDARLDPGVSSALRGFLKHFAALEEVSIEAEWAGILGLADKPEPNRDPNLDAKHQPKPKPKPDSESTWE